jgi:hypothetical protein
MNIILALLVSTAPVQVSDSIDALRVVAAIVQEKHDKLRSPKALKTREGKSLPILLNVGSVIAAIQAGTGQEVRNSEVDAVIKPKFRDVTAEGVIRCAPWKQDPRKEECWVVDEGFYIELKSLARTATGWEAVVNSQFTSEGHHRPGQLDVQWNQFRYVYVNRNGNWVKVKEELSGQS